MRGTSGATIASSPSTSRTAVWPALQWKAAPSFLARSRSTPSTHNPWRDERRKATNMIRLLGRATSGNVQKVIFLLEEMGLPYRREDYGRQFNNTGGDYLKLNPTGKVPTLLDE